MHFFEIGYIYLFILGDINIDIVDLSNSRIVNFEKIGVKLNADADFWRYHNFDKRFF